MSRPGLILFAHGARDPAWARPFEAVVAQLRQQRPGCDVRLAFLDFLAPDLAGAAEQLVTAGCRSVAVLPLFLGTGGHLKRDLPRLVQRLGDTHPGVAWSLLEAAGEHPAMIAAMASIAVQALDTGLAGSSP